VHNALARCESALAASDGTDREPLLADCAERAQLPEALAAIDMALWDLAGRRAGEPVWKLLGGVRPPVVSVNATIGAEHPSRAAAESAAATAHGFDCLKVKVGTGEDELRLAAVRDAIGARPRIRVDANGVWSPAQAIDMLASLDAYDLELCEEPVHGLDRIGTVAAAVGVPIAADESTREPGAFSQRMCDAVCLKIARCGGIAGLVRDAAAARAAGYEIYLASTLDGPLGIAAALHATAAVTPDRHCGLATLARFDRPDPMPARAGMMSASPGPGLGSGLLDWYGLTSARQPPPGSRDVRHGRRSGSR
jgi:L-alanine-DL-glutamate epimerase-like enolase superfamily enzyme